MPETVPRIDIAIGHLDSAIQLVVDFAAYAPALTLAGAAEEMLESFLTPRDMAHAIHETYDLVPGQIDPECSQRLLKQWRESNASTAAEDIETAAVCQILRGLTKLDVLERRPANWQRWRQWVDETWSDA